MAAISGQPSPKPGSVPDPVPGESEFQAALKSIDSAPKESEFGAALKNLPSGQDTTEQTPPERPWYAVSGQGIVRGAIEDLPTVGGIAGAVLGYPAGFAGAIRGSALGGIAGASLRDTLNSYLYNEGPKTYEEQVKNLAIAGAEQGAGASIGEALPVIGKALKGLTKEGVAAIGNKLAGVPGVATGNYLAAPDAVKKMAVDSGGDVLTAADKIRSELIQPAIKATRETLEKPALEVLVNKSTPMSAAQTGDAVKDLIRKNVTQRYGPFQKAYSALDTINQNLPIRDDARKNFQDSLTKWALDEFPQSSSSWRTVKSYADSFTASNNGKQFNSVIRDLNGELSAAYRSGNYEQARLLIDIKTRATDFMDGQVEGLAKRIAANKHTTAEVDFINQLGQAQGMTDNPMFHVKELANDYLKNKAMIDKDYSGFKEFINSLGEQTRVRGKGPMNFLENLDSIPSEKLTENMLNKKNYAALEAMKKETPEVFDAISRYHVKTLMEASTNKAGELDLGKFTTNMRKLSPEIRNIVFTPQDQITIEKTLANPKYVKFNTLLNNMDESLIKPGLDPKKLVNAGARKSGDNYELKQLSELSLLTNTNMVQDTKTLSAMKYFAAQPTLKAQILKAPLDLAVGINQRLPSLGPLTPATRNVLGQAVRSSGQTLGNILQPSGYDVSPALTQSPDVFQQQQLQIQEDTGQ